MTPLQNVGVIAVGSYLPPMVRTNDWWPEEIVAGWRHRIHRMLPRAKEHAEKSGSPGAVAAVEAMLTLGEDPFCGIEQRHIANPEQRSSDLETAAVEQVLDRTGTDPREIDLLLTHSIVPDFMGCNQAAIVHHRLGLRSDCWTLMADAICNSPILQLKLAQGLIQSGMIRRALLVQSCLVSRLMPQHEPFSAVHGDAATALLVGPVAPDRGLLAATTRVDGSLAGALVLGHPEGSWYDELPTVAYVADRNATRQMVQTASDFAKALVEQLLETTGYKKSDVDFYGAHQPTHWFRRVTQQYAGLAGARSADTFAQTGTTVACNMPLQLARAISGEKLSQGDLVMLFSVGSGMPAAAALLRW